MPLKLAFVLAVLLFNAEALIAQVLKQPIATRYLPLGAYSKNYSDAFSGIANQASYAKLDKTVLGAYGEKRFLLKELSGFLGIVAVPFKSGTIGLQCDYFGSALNNESQAGLFYARKITDKIDAGVKFNYYTIKFAGYGSTYAINAEAGLIYHVSDPLHVGIHVYNPTGSKLNIDNAGKLPVIVKSGIGYEVSPVVFLSFELEKQQGERLNVNAGFQYNIHKKVFVRGGIATYTHNNYVTIGLHLGFARADIITSYHPHLGFTPGFLLLVDLKKQNRD